MKQLRVMEIANSADLDKWLFDHAQVQMHPCHSVKGEVPGEGHVNVAWVDIVTGERFDIDWHDPTLMPANKEKGQ